ncbi:MAG: nitrate reductase molybdenum cofactor assembly chaperone [Planctomycetaceae bacterium]
MAGPRTLKRFCALLSYPGAQTGEACELLYVILQSELPAAARNIAQFGVYLERHALWEVEEAYTATFDVNPACALEIGWHLFGEEYDRGLLLVRLREELRRHGLSESCELPDHLIHVLPLIGAMSDAEAQRFVTACVQPAVQKMQQAAARSDSPYRNVLDALAAVLQSVWGEGRPMPDGSQVHRADGQTIPEGVDLLHAFPAADVQFGCGGCPSHDGCEEHPSGPPLVQLTVGNSRSQEGL